MKEGKLKEQKRQEKVHDYSYTYYYSLKFEVFKETVEYFKTDSG